MSIRKSKKLFNYILSLVVIIFIGIFSYFNTNIKEQILSTYSTENSIIQNSYNIDNIPKYSSLPYITINNNTPSFTEEQLTTSSFENYSKLDSLGRCGIAFANLSIDTMPLANDERESISSITPSGWINKKYENIDGGYLYNRCHLVGYQLSAENANKKNLITGTRYMNTQGMLPFENKVAEYIKETRNHVLYRVTPIYEGKNLVASGVQIEAKSVEDDGKGICFNIYCYNVQPGITIDYKTGESKESV